VKIQRFPLHDENPPRLELRWEGSQGHVYFDGAHAATLDGFAGLKKGWSTELEDGRRLELRMIRRVLFPELSVLVDGQHVASSPSHPDRMLRSSSNALLFLSAFVILMGFRAGGVAAVVDVAFGVCYLIGALLLRARRRLGAAVIAVPLFVEFDLTLLTAFLGTFERRWWVDIVLNLVFATFVIRSYQAARDSRLMRG